MCSQNSHKDFSSEIIKYRPAVYNKKSKEKYVFFYVLDPESVKNGCSKLKRIRTKFNRYATAKERDEAAMRYVRDINQRLESGWNPLIQDSTNKSWCSLQGLFEKYRRYLEKCKKENVLKMKTYVDYSSRLRTFEEFTKKHSLNYIYQLKKPYAESFLDYIYIDRDNAPRTRNNYLIWLSSFCTWLVDGGYLECNPCAKIKSLRNGEKNRKAVDEASMARLEEHLMNTDKNFLLACLFAYYTLCRPIEMSQLKLSDINLKNQTVFCSKEISKNRKDGVVTLPTKVIHLMLDLEVFKNPDDYYLFGKGFVPSDKPCRPSQFTVRWEKLREELNFPDEYKFYSLKDSGITKLINKVGITVARDQARHSSVAVTNVYVSKDQMHAHPELKNYK